MSRSIDFSRRARASSLKRLAAVLAACLLAVGLADSIAGAQEPGWQSIYLPRVDRLASALRPAWVQSNEGLESWAFVGLAIDPEEPRNVYALTRSQGLWVSKDGGDHWIADNRGLVAPHTVWDGRMCGNLLTIDPSLFYSSPPYLGFLYSTYGGHYWRRATPLGEGRRAGTVVAGHPTITNRVVLGYPGGSPHRRVRPQRRVSRLDLERRAVLPFGP